MIRIDRNLTVATLVVAAVATGLDVGDAVAQSATFGGTVGADKTWLNNPGTVVSDAWTLTKRIIYIVSGLGMALLASMAAFGKFEWRRLGYLAGALLLFATFDQAITYFGGGAVGTDQLSNGFQNF